MRIKRLHPLLQIVDAVHQLLAVVEGRDFVNAEIGLDAPVDVV